MSPLLKDRYRKMEDIGDGGFGLTYLAEDTDRFDERCVIKQLKPLADDPETYEHIKARFEREAATLLDLSRLPNVRIPKFQAFFTDGREFYLVQELIEGRNLAEKVDFDGPLAAAEVERIVCDVLSTLNEVHARGIIHRDLKPENIMVRAADGACFLIDFGAVKEVVASKVAARRGVSSFIFVSQGFTPFEQINGHPVFASDLYSLGLTAVYLLTGKRPCEMSTNAAGEVEWAKHAPPLSPSFEAAIEKSIRLSAAERFQTARDMFDAIKADARRGGYTRRVPRSSGTESGAVAGAAAQDLSAGTSDGAELKIGSKIIRRAAPEPPRRSWLKRLIVATLLVFMLAGAAYAAVRYKEWADRRVAAAVSSERKAIEARERAEADKESSKELAARKSKEVQELEVKVGKLPALDITDLKVQPGDHGFEHGVWVHVSYRAHNLRDVNCRFYASVFDTEGEPLTDIDDEVLTRSETFVPSAEEETKEAPPIFFSDGDLYEDGDSAKLQIRIRISKKSTGADDYFDAKAKEFDWTYGN